MRTRVGIALLLALLLVAVVGSMSPAAACYIVTSMGQYFLC